MLRRDACAGLLVVASLTALALTGCASDLAEPEPEPVPSASASASAAPASERPGARVALSCDDLVPTAAAGGFENPSLRGVVDLDSATVAQAGWTWCSWGAEGRPRLEVVVIPDGPVEYTSNEPCALFPAGPGCSAQIAAGSTVVAISAQYTADSTLPDADESFQHIVENVGAIVGETPVAPATPVQRTVPQSAVTGLDPATVAGWFGVDPDGGIPLGVPQEVLGDTAYTQTASETAAWGTEEAAWVQVDLLPGGGWAAAGLPDAQAAGLQSPSLFETVEVPGLTDAVLAASSAALTLCGSLGTDLVCVSSYEVPEDTFLAGVASVVAALT